ncbi:MAG TPA: 3D domain-containing protein [Polyangiaceae bacterium]|jgi:3D (Asp-Asp-Asp) domain-containing protein
MPQQRSPARPGHAPAARSRALNAHTLSDTGAADPAPDSADLVSASQGSPPAPRAASKLQGRILGTFRNTYYDFPSEPDFQGELVALKDARCNTIKQVPRGFYESVCVQGSGTLATGTTVSFAKRDCSCAPICPRTEQKICFEALDHEKFPWGRGATGNAITPLLTAAVDSDVIPIDTPIYIPEFDGAPRDPNSNAPHDGCFIAQDRGVRVKGKHVDLFTGSPGLTRLWNQVVPSNRGVTVVLDSPRCAREGDVSKKLKR